MDGYIHEPSRPILFNEFIEFIIRIANEKYNNCEKMIWKRFDKLINDNLQFACKSDDNFNNLFYTEDINQYLLEEQLDLNDLFLKLIEKESHYRYENIYNCSIFLISILREIKELGVLSFLL